MLSVIFVNDSKEDADEYVHADDDVNNEEDAVPVVVVVRWHSTKEVILLEKQSQHIASRQ